MAVIQPESLQKLVETIRQLRAIPHVREDSPGLFKLQGQPFVVIHDDGGALSAELRKPSGVGMDRLTLADAPQRRKLVDEAKRRAAKITDE